MSTILLVITNCFCEAHASFSVKVSFWSDIQILACVLLMHFGSPFLLVGPHFIRNLTNLGSHCMWEKWGSPRELSAGEPPIDPFALPYKKKGSFWWPPIRVEFVLIHCRLCIVALQTLQETLDGKKGAQSTMVADDQSTQVADPPFTQLQF